MKRILIVGSGDVACRAIPWLVRRFKVFALTRQAESCAALRALGAVPVLADLDDRSSLHHIAGISDAVLHFAPPPAIGLRDTRTAHLLAALASRRSLPQRIVYISTTGVYGDCGGEWIDETRTVRPATARAQRRVDAERRLRCFGRRTRVGISVLRAPGIYAADRLPLTRFGRGDPVLLDGEDVYTNHIHAEDLARLACLALFRARSGRAYNAVDGTDMKMGEYFDFAADFFGLSRPARMGRAQLREVLSPMALSFLSESRRISNRRILEEFRVELLHPTVREGFAAARFSGSGESGCCS